MRKPAVLEASLGLERTSVRVQADPFGRGIVRTSRRHGPAPGVLFLRVRMSSLQPRAEDPSLPGGQPTGRQRPHGRLGTIGTWHEEGGASTAMPSWCSAGIFIAPGPSSESMPDEHAGHPLSTSEN